MQARVREVTLASYPWKEDGNYKEKIMVKRMFNILKKFKNQVYILVF